MGRADRRSAEESFGGGTPDPRLVGRPVHHYICPGKLSREEIESVGYRYGDLAAMLERYDPKRLRDGWNVLPDGERIYYVSNPALGLWAYRGRLND